MKKNIENKKGFTLVELLVVIAIIGILTGMVITGLDSSKAKARDEKRISDIKSVQLSLEIFRSANGFYPNYLDNLVPDYIPEIPGNEEILYAPYGSTINCRHYHIGIQLEGVRNEKQDDFDSSDASLVGGICGDGAGGGEGFYGATDNLYDLKK